MNVSRINSLHLPEDFIKQTADSLGEEACAAFLEEMDAGNSVTSIRINPLKSGFLAGKEPAVEICAGKGAVPVEWCASGWYLKERPVFTLDPLFHGGAYYVQEASSMFPELAYRAIDKDCPGFWNRSLKVLDLCAAPGGKSTHLASLLNSGSILVSNEVIRTRAVLLADHVAKWGAANVVVSNNDPADFSVFPDYFHVILVDAPCSGEGMFRKEPETIKEWSPAQVVLCARRQQRILQDIWGSLLPGGYLIYSTCTFNHFENDDNLRYLVDEFGAEVVSVDGAIEEKHPAGTICKTNRGGYQFVPGLVRGEGQFFVVMRKPDHVPGRVPGKKVPGAGRKEKRPSFLKTGGYLPAGEYVNVLANDLVKGYPVALADEIFQIERCLRVIHSGVATAVKKGNDYVPHADLALSVALGNLLEKGACPFKTVPLDKENALRFLAKEPLVFETAPSGYLFLTYRGLGLGFVKNLGPRSNNLLPPARRIRMNINRI